MRPGMPSLASGQIPNLPAFAAERAALPVRRVIGAYWTHARYETLAALRNPGFAFPFLVVPTAIYLLIGVLVAGKSAETSAYGPAIHDYLFSGFCVLAAIMPGIFSSAILATERDGHLLLLRRALPLPPGATILAKVVMSVVVAALAVTSVAIAALLFGPITLGVSQVASLVAVLTVGTIPFTAIGLLLGTLVSGSAAPAWGNLVFLPQIWLSGLFMPLPASLERLVIVWPTFHLNQLALAAGGVTKFQFLPPTVCAAVLAGVTVLCGGGAVRRLARRG